MLSDGIVWFLVRMSAVRSVRLAFSPVFIIVIGVVVTEVVGDSVDGKPSVILPAAGAFSAARLSRQRRHACCIVMAATSSCFRRNVVVIGSYET